MIIDSGDRTQFYDKNGKPIAQRDMHEGKGRMDLVPLAEVARIIDDAILEDLDSYIRSGDIYFLINAFKYFAEEHYPDIYTAILEVSIHYSEGAKKYQPRNWEKGIYLSSYIDSASRHYMKVLRGDDDEPHARAFMWNILGAMWTHNNIPDMNDLPWANNEE